MSRWRRTPRTPSELRCLPAGRVGRSGRREYAGLPVTSVVLGVTGSVAAYKACELVRRLGETGHEVTVVASPSALRFVGEASFAALSGRPVLTSIWDYVDAVPHVALGRAADLVLVYPATADLLARAAAGRADDLLTATLLTARCPVLLSPAMHTEMWQHPATRANVAVLRSRGTTVLDPAVGRLTGPDSGPGRLPEPAEVLDHARDALTRSAAGLAGRPRDLAGRRVVVTAGGTREDLDPVRFLGNRSSGRQGFALARAAAVRGATVTLIAANPEAAPDLLPPAGVDLVPVTDTASLRSAVLAAAADADVVVMAAAVADFRPASTSTTKVHRPADGSARTVELVQNPDVLAELCRARARDRPGQVVVGFAAESPGPTRADQVAAARAKLARKGADLLVANEVGAGRGFGTVDNAAVVVGADGSVSEVGRAPKLTVAHGVLDLVAARLGPPGTEAPLV